MGGLLAARVSSSGRRARDTNECLEQIAVITRTGGVTDIPPLFFPSRPLRGSRTPVFLETLGYGHPREDHVGVRVLYSSRLLRIPPGMLEELIVLVSSVPGRPTVMALFAYENNTWMFTVGRMVGREPPTEPAEMLAFVEGLAQPHVLAAFFRAGAKPVGVAWKFAVGGDLNRPEVEGPRRLSTRFTNRYVDRVQTAAESDIVVGEQLTKVVALLDPPTLLLHPKIIFRVVTVNLPRRQRDSRPRQAGVTGRVDGRTPLPDVLSE
jgi:hypothetical protein